jgi:hypothetical protein
MPRDQQMRIFNYCKRHPDVCPCPYLRNQCSNKTPVVTKIPYIFLLEVNSKDRSNVITLEYYFTNYPNYVTGTIIDTTIDANGNQLYTNAAINANTVRLLNYYYYTYSTRLFVCGSRSTVLAYSLENFFKYHIDAIGISFSSSADTLSIPKNIYRMQPPDSDLIDSLSSLITVDGTTRQIMYIYTADEVASVSLLIYLLEKYGPSKVSEFAATDTNLTTDNINSFFSGVTQENSNQYISIMYLFVNNQSSTYINLFNSNNNLLVDTYDISISGVAITSETDSASIANKYNYLDFISTSRSVYFRSGQDNVTINFVSTVPNVLEMINNYTQNNESLQIDVISSHNGIIEFDKNGDMEYFTLSIKLYTQVDGVYVFVLKYLYLYDPEFSNGILIPF